MDITPLIKRDAQVIQSYSPGRFRVSGAVYHGPVIVMESGTHKWNTKRSVSNFKEEDLDIIKAQAAAIDLVLFGCGAQMEFLPQALRNYLKALDIATETMDTGAACRSYNVLLTEGRRAAAALLPL